MNFEITKSARQFGYLIWNMKNGKELEKLLEKYDDIEVTFNGFELGKKNIDKKYHRISLGYKLTRAMPQKHNYYFVEINEGVLEVKSYNGSR